MGRCCPSDRRAINHTFLRQWFILDTHEIIARRSAGQPLFLSFVLWMLLRTIPRRSAGRWLLVACFSCVKNHNVSGPHLFPSFTTQAKKIPLPPLGRSYSEQKNHFAMQFQTLFLPHRFIKIRPSHQTPVSIECLTICRIPEFPKSEQNQKSCGNMRI